MAKASAWIALGAAAAIVVAVVVNRFELGAIGPIIGALLLVFGAWRTLRAMSGGLRLLCGAWGVAAGLAWYAPSYNFPDFMEATGMAGIAAPILVSAIGLALVVLHKEKKA